MSTLVLCKEIGYRQLELLGLKSKKDIEKWCMLFLQTFLNDLGIPGSLGEIEICKKYDTMSFLVVWRWNYCEGMSYAITNADLENAADVDSYVEGRLREVFPLDLGEVTVLQKPGHVVYTWEPSEEKLKEKGVVYYGMA